MRVTPLCILGGSVVVKCVDENAHSFPTGRHWYVVLVVVLGALLVSSGGCGSSDNPSAQTAAASFIVCNSTFALCTTAQCTRLAGAPGFDSCNCNVMTGYSAGTTQCQDVQDTGEGQAIISRYYPISSYAPCSNDRPWSWCLNSPCLIDPNDSSTATCICTEMVNRGTYIIVNANQEYSPTSCNTGLYSSATVVDLNQITEFLRTNDTPLKALPITVYNGQ
jgi:hypothetical protein